MQNILRMRGTILQNLKDNVVLDPATFRAPPLFLPRTIGTFTITAFILACTAPPRSAAQGHAKSGLSKNRRARDEISGRHRDVAGCIRGRPRASYRERIVTVHNFPGIGALGDRRVITA